MGLEEEVARELPEAARQMEQPGLSLGWAGPSPTRASLSLNKDLLLLCQLLGTSPGQAAHPAYRNHRQQLAPFTEHLLGAGPSSWLVP